MQSDERMIRWEKFTLYVEADEVIPEPYLIPSMTR